MPRTNAVMQRWIQICRHKLLNRTLLDPYGQGLSAPAG
jgi:hypothetical protein